MSYQWSVLALALGAFVFAQMAVAQDVSTDEAVPESAAVVASQTPPEPVDLCAGITCSGHGNCRVVSGDPVCVCDAGFQADPATKLGCLPLAPAPVYSQHPMVTEGEYQAALQRRKTGLALMVPGIILTVAGTGLLIGAFYADDSEKICSGGDCDTIEEASNPELVQGLAIGGLVSFGVGLGLMIPGIVKRAKGGAVMRRYQAQQAQLAKLSPRITPFVNLNARYQGAGLRVSF